MGQAVGQERGQRALRIAVDADGKAGGAARGGSAPVRADHQGGGDDAPVFELRRRPFSGEVVGRDGGLDPLDARRPLRAAREHFGHAVVLDVPAERLEADLRAMELDRARREQRARVVDDPQAAHRRRAGLDRRPKAERIEIGDGPVEHRDGAAARRPLVPAA